MSERPGERPKFQYLPALYLALRRIGEDPMDCEGPGHGTEDERHDEGPGKWYVAYKCPVCYATKCDLICSGYLKYLAIRNALFTCHCGATMDFQTYKLGITKRKGKGGQ